MISVNVLDRRYKNEVAQRQRRVIECLSPYGSKAKGTRVNFKADSTFTSPCFFL